MKILSIFPHKSHTHNYKVRTKLNTIVCFQALIICFSCILLSCGKFEVQELDIYENLEGLVNIPGDTTRQRSITHSHSNTVTPTRKVHPSRIPIYFIDDSSFVNMDTAINRQLQYFQRFYLSGTIQFGNDVYPRSMLPLALKKFQRLYHAYYNCLRRAYNARKNYDTCMYSFHNTLVNQFNIYEPDITPVDRDNPTFFTGYYTPKISGSRRQTNRFRYAVYAKPRENRLRRLTRYKIDFKNELAGHGYELFYTDDLFALYNLHIQGGGKTDFVDGSRNFYLSYDGNNGKKRRPISKYMERRGMIRNESIAAQKAYLKAHPDRQAEVYGQSPGYVYFRPSVNPPIGSIDVSLTDGRSIATGKKHYSQKGILAFVQAKKPHYETWSRTGQVKMQTFSRFVLDQDTGSAIRDKARVDFYFGETKYAEIAANHLNTQGKLFFLMPKQVP